MSLRNYFNRKCAFGVGTKFYQNPYPRMHYKFVALMGSHPRSHYRELFSIVCVCVCVPQNQTRKYCATPRAEGDISSEDRGSSRGWIKLYSGVLHVLYWWVNVGGEWTERQWDRWVKRNELQKLRKHKILVGNVERERHFERSSSKWNVKRQRDKLYIKICNSSFPPLSKIQTLISLYQFCYLKKNSLFKKSL